MIILVTGGASGLGRAITTRLANNLDNTIFFTYFSSEASAKAIELEFKNTRSIKVDFCNRESLNEFIDQISKISPEVLINNALTGYSQHHFHKINPVIFSESFEKNVLPILKITQRFICERRKYKFGKIITILTSALLNKPPIGWSEYVANKSYLLAMSKSWVTENINFGITSNCISPSFMLTNLTANTDSRLIESIINESPNKQLLKEDEVSSVIDFLIKSSPHINGQNIVINAAKDLA